ncbi:unnamed protein product [Onchocerca ochengi]|uniref:RxLR effector protein n=1 Tax=Onchocerca ochengi TaxID=42157 RepID=A0A182EBT4_ONCOC|nr:unnamed protein product [Onchocerca ochengi]
MSTSHSTQLDSTRFPYDQNVPITKIMTGLVRLMLLLLVAHIAAATDDDDDVDDGGGAMGPNVKDDNDNNNGSGSTQIGIKVANQSFEE